MRGGGRIYGVLWGGSLVLTNPRLNDQICIEASLYCKTNSVGEERRAGGIDADNSSIKGASYSSLSLAMGVGSGKGVDLLDYNVK